MLKKIRKTPIKKEEIKADALFILTPLIISAILLFIFDIHWNFYPGGQLIPPAKHVFTNTSIYLWGSLLGSIIGFFIIKLFLLGVKEEESVWKSRRPKRKIGN